MREKWKTTSLNIFETVGRTLRKSANGNICKRRSWWCVMGLDRGSRGTTVHGETKFLPQKRRFRLCSYRLLLILLLREWAWQNKDGRRIIEHYIHFSRSRRANPWHLLIDGLRLLYTINCDKEWRTTTKEDLKNPGLHILLCKKLLGECSVLSNLC